MTTQPGEPFASVLARRRRAVHDQLSGILSGGPHDFVWEIGCGHGHFLTAYAADRPQHLCVGVDIAGDRIERANKKLARAKLPNLHFLRTDAQLFLEALPDHGRIQTVFILFPDPWPKLRHHKHRIFQSQLLTALAGRASPDCRLYFRTDFEPYYLAATTTVRSSPQWELLEEPWPFESMTVFQSRAERHDSFVARLRAPIP
jgi:tRNA (guanine-N7-)-methyltransferase